MVYGDEGAVITGMGVKIGLVALGAGAAGAAVDGRIAMAVGSWDSGTVGAGVTVGAVIFMDDADWIAAVTGDAEGGGGDRRCMAVGVGGEIGGMAAVGGGAAGARPSSDMGDCILCDRVSQGRGGGVAFAAGVLVHSHRVVGRVTDRDAGWGVSHQTQGANAGGAMIHQTMEGGFVWMTGQAAGRVVALADDALDRNPGTWSRLAGLVVAGVAGV